MATLWQSETSDWLEDDETGAFELVAHRGLGVRVAGMPLVQQHDAARWLGAALPLTCECSAVFPPDFAFCPHCGAALQTPSGAAAAFSWLGPFADQALPEHVPRGMALSASSLATRMAALPPVARPDLGMPAPPAAPCLFFSGDFGFAGARLLALSWRQNVLQYWNPVAADWQILAAGGDVAMSDLCFTTSDFYALPPLSREPGAVALIPAAHGLMQLMLNPLQNSYHLQPLLVARLVASAGRVFSHLACLILDDDGQITLWSRQVPAAADSLADSLINPLAVAAAENALPAAQVWPACAPASCTGGWSRPFAYQGKLIWLHASGHLLWQPGSAPKWLPWPAGWQPRHAYAAPMQSRDGRLWQLGQGPEGYAFLELATATPQQEATDGARLGFAHIIYRLGHPLHGEPWGSFTVENENDHNALVWPLLACHDSNRRLQGVLAVRLPDYVGTVEQLFLNRSGMDSKIEWLGETHVELERLQLARPWELCVVVRDGCLWMQHPDWSRMGGWRLPEAA